MRYFVQSCPVCGFRNFLLSPDEGRFANRDGVIRCPNCREDIIPVVVERCEYPNSYDLNIFKKIL